jgi:hypothetical protein
METLQIDIGASAIKWYHKDKCGKFITAVDRVNVIDGFKVNDKSIEYKGKNYIVGRASHESLLSRDFNFFKEYSAIFVYKVLQELNITDTSNLSLNIGFSYIYVNKFQEIVNELDCFEVNSNQYCFKEINCFIQGQGIYNHLGLNGTVAIYDIGYHTNDFLLFDTDGQLMENESDKNGIMKIVTKLQSTLNYKFDLTLSEHQTNEILQSKILKYKGEPIDVSDDIEPLLKTYINDTINNLSVKHGSKLDVCDYVVIGGGGANYFKDIAFPNGTILETDEYANAKGYIV